MERALLALSEKQNENQGEETASSSKGKRIRLKDGDIAVYCRKHNIRTITELLADAETRIQEGDDTLHNYIHSRTLKQLSELLTKDEMMKNARSKVEGMNVSRMNVIRSYREKDCVVACNGVWYQCAMDILRRSEINKYVFADAIREVVEKGRGRKRNIFLLGPTSSGKTFLLKPLLHIFPYHFTNPAASSFGWLGAEEANVILLNDFRWENKRNGGSIAWGDLLNLLEGMETKLPAPMNSFAKHIVIKTDVPIFGTGPDRLKWYSNQSEEPRKSKHAKEDAQMEERWKTFELKHSFTGKERIADIEPCGSCFAKMFFLGYDE